MIEVATHMLILKCSDFEYLQIFRSSGSFKELIMSTAKTAVSDEEEQEQRRLKVNGWTCVAVLTLLAAFGHWCVRPTSSVTIQNSSGFTLNSTHIVYAFQYSL